MKAGRNTTQPWLFDETALKNNHTPIYGWLVQAVLDAPVSSESKAN
jgi:hypothetical protein